MRYQVPRIVDFVWVLIFLIVAISGLQLLEVVIHKLGRLF